MSLKSPATVLHNQFDRETLRARLLSHPKERMVVSFYRYVDIKDPIATRDELYKEWFGLDVLGRVYLAREGVNAQISVPRDRFEEFQSVLYKYFPNVPLKYALENNPESFLKLVLKVKNKIVADGLNDNEFDVSNVGNHLTAKEFNKAMDDPNTILVDVRNHYESEVGHFKGAILPDVSSFREELPVIRDMLQTKKDKKILLYCTGGIRCEKTSSWLKHHGFKDVNQLHGGIIDYVRQVKEQNLDNKFIGKNFVFDERLVERVTNDVIAHCHVCEKNSDSHTNCRWQACHILLILCDECSEKYEGCCSENCYNKTLLPEEEQKQLRKAAPQNPPGFFKGKRRKAYQLAAHT